MKMGFDIYEEKVLSFSNIVMKQKRVLSYIFIGLSILQTKAFKFLITRLCLLSFLKGMFTSLMKKLYPSQDGEYSQNVISNTDRIGKLINWGLPYHIA